MARIELAQGNWKLVEVDEPPLALPIELAKLKLSMYSKEACCYNFSYINMTVGSYPIPVDEQGL